MARFHLPSPLGYLHLCTRTAALLLTHGILTTALYLSLFHHLTLVAVYIVLAVCVLLDTAEIITLVTRLEDGIQRLPTGLLIAIETLVLCLYLVACAVSYDMWKQPETDAGTMQQEAGGEKEFYFRRLWLLVRIEVGFRFVAGAIVVVEEALWRREMRRAFGAQRQRAEFRVNYPWYT